MKISAPFFVFLFLGAFTVVADDQVRRVQEELRKRNVYFGEVDGRKTPEMTGAVRRYQERKGFAATGEIDGDTLRSLELAPPLNPAPTWPEGPVMKSDSARELEESDRKLLESMGPTEVTPIAEGPPEEAPAPALREKPSTPPSSVAEPGTERARAFVQEYLDACETNQLDAELGFYGDRVNYFDHGQVGREFIARDVQRFYKHWPRREYELLDFKVVKAEGEELVVLYKISFRYKAPAKSAAGRALNRFTIRRAEGEMRFVALKEQVLRN